jgi:hypothetical protein
MSVMELEGIGERYGQEVIDAQDERLGKLEEIYLDPDTDLPAYACVRAGLFGRRLSFVSLTGATLGDGYVRLAFLRARVQDAPQLRPDAQLTREEARRLSEHYGPEPPAPAEDPSPAPGISPGDGTEAGRELLARLDALERRVRELQNTLG